MVDSKLLIRFNVSIVFAKYRKNASVSQLLFFIRKNRIFNKSRYSRNRQLYRTGVY
jgi:hypothetical protein